MFDTKFNVNMSKNFIIIQNERTNGQFFFLLLNIELYLRTAADTIDSLSLNEKEKRKYAQTNSILCFVAKRGTFHIPSLSTPCMSYSYCEYIRFVGSFE